MDYNYKQAFAEVLEVLRNSSLEIAKKIPQKFIIFLEENLDNEYIVNIDFSDENWENSVKEETRAILALIYRDYIVSPEEREKLLEEEKQEQIKIEKELAEKYNPDNLFKKKEIPTEIENNTQLAIIEEYPWYKRILKKILKIFGIK